MALFGNTMYTALVSCLLTLALGKEPFKGSKHADNLATHTLPSSCKNLEDGYHYLKLMEDTADTTYPIVYAQCSNGYVMIDYNQDDSWSDYFTSWVKYHYAVSGPSRNDKSNWAEWFLPNAASISYTNDVDYEIVNVGSYVISPDCSSCDEEAEYQLNDDSSTYYMSALAFGCFNPVRGWPACDMDFDAYTCKICEWDDDGTQISSYERPITLTHEEIDDEGLKAGVCDFEIRSSVETTPNSFSKCSIMGDDNKNWKPSLGLDSRFCQCWQPTHSKIKSHVQVSEKQYNKKMMDQEFNKVSPHEKNDHVRPSRKDIYQLYQDDFEKGTYRITKSGTYLVMEDIVLNFNPAPEGTASVNHYDDNWWWPTSDQVDEYPGAQEARDAYFLGFFAGITIEVDDVVLDLQGHEIKMHQSFYYQQPYFSIIELESQPFLPQQGPGFFGSDPLFPASVEIRNGVLGLSSHHAIHGNWNDDILIEDLHVKDFQTHGIQLNGFDGLTVRNCEIGPTTEIAFLNGNYGHMRLIMPTLKSVAQDSDSQVPNTIHFSGRSEPVTMWALLDKLVEEMDMAYNFAMYGTTYDDHPFWQEAVEMFISPSGLPYGAVLYGLFLNYPSAGIFGWHVNDKLSYNATVENVYIHDLRHKGIEVVGFQYNGRVFCNAFNGPLPAHDIFGEEVWNVQHSLKYDDDEPVEASYSGTIISDIHIAQFFWGKDNFDYWPGIPYLGKHDQLLKWATGKNETYVADRRSIIDFSCNEDAMFHPSKGLVGVKASGVDGLVIKNVKLENIQDETPLGSDLCGYKSGKYHFSQQSPYQIGYSMNMVMGMTLDFVSNTDLSDISIDKMTSDTGLVYGLATWFQSDITLHGELSINELTAGYSIDDDTFTWNSRPNKAAESCSFLLYDDATYPLDVKFEDDFKLSQSCMQGAVGCKNDKKKTRVKDVEADESSCEFSLVHDYAPNDISEVIKSKFSTNEQNMYRAGLVRAHLFGSTAVDVTFISVSFLFVAMVLILKLRFLWCPSMKKSSSDEVTPLMVEDRQIYQ